MSVYAFDPRHVPGVGRGARLNENHTLAHRGLLKLYVGCSSMAFLVGLSTCHTLHAASGSNYIPTLVHLGIVHTDSGVGEHSSRGHVYSAYHSDGCVRSHGVYD